MRSGMSLALPQTANSLWTRVWKRVLSIDEAYSTLAPDGLTGAAIVYLAIPNLIFLCGWLRPWFALGFACLLLTGLWYTLRRTSWTVPQTRGAMVIIVAAGFLWSILGGAGHFVYANPDWYVRDTILGDLTLTDWPPSYSVVNGVHHILRSAIGFFLPAALIGKLFGLGSVDIALYLWTAFGISLFLLLLPLPRRAGKLLALCLLVVIFFSGMDALGIILVSGELPIFPLRLEWWVQFSYTSISGMLLWAPNHALPLWLTSALFYRHWGHERFAELVVVLLPLLVVWTPFAVIGILPFVGLAMLYRLRQGRSLLAIGIAPLQLASTIGLTYLMLRLMTLNIGGIDSAPIAEISQRPNSLVHDYLIFALMEYAILALLMARELQHSWGVFWLSFAILSLLPLYQYGPSNDSLLRLSTPCLVFLMILLTDMIQGWWSRPELRTHPGAMLAIGIAMLIGACTPFNELWRSASYHRTPPNYRMNLVETQHGNEAPHYVGRLDRRDLLLLLREPSLVTKSGERR